MNSLIFSASFPSSTLRAPALLCWAGVAAVAWLGLPLHAQTPDTLPTGGQITSGTGTITQSGSQLTVHQATDRMIARWDSFNIGTDAAVQFVQPDAGSVALNRIHDQNPSQILGALRANGAVFLVNPSGIFFGANATVDVGSIVAASLALADEDFLRGEWKFADAGGAGAVTNAGRISARQGGVVALLAPVVNNAGTISAPGGSVALAAGSQVSLDFQGDGLISLTVDEAAVSAQAANSGLIQADGGVVIMTARAARELAGTVVNNSGIVEADTLSTVNGRILLDGGSAGLVSQTGTLSATGAGAGQTGGAITITGEKVALSGEAVIDASGAGGGGTIRVGGGFRGADSTVANATRTFVGDATAIRADGGQTGDGGQVVVWSDEATHFAGTLSARGGALSGDGGDVEISSKGGLALSGRIDAGAPQGAAGKLLLDPRNLTIETGAGAALTAVDEFLDTPASDLTIDPVTITAATNAGTDVILQANSDIVLNSSIVSFNLSGAGGDLTFQAGRSIILNGAVISDDGNVFFTVNDANATADRQAGAAVFTNNGLIDADDGSVTITVGTNAGGSGAVSLGQITANDLTVVHNGPTAGAVTGAIDFGETTIDDALSITSSSARNVTNVIGSVIARGTTTINVGTGNVTFDRATTDFNILALTNAGNVLLNDTNAMRFGASNLTGTLTSTTLGPLASTGAITVGGLATLTANNGGFGYADPYISLTNANDFQGGLTLSVASTGATATGGYVAITDANALSITSASINRYLTLNAGGAVDLGTITLGTDLTVATNGAITDSGTLVVPGSSIFSPGAGNDTTLNSAANNFGSIRFTNGRHAEFIDVNAATLAATSVTGNLTVTTGAAFNIAGSTAVTVGGAFTGNVTGATTFSGNDSVLNLGSLNFTTSGAFTTGQNTDITVSAGDYTIVAGGAITYTLFSDNYVTAGNLSLTAGGNITQGYDGNGSRGRLTASGTTTFTVTAASSSIDLQQDQNSFAGALTLSTSGAGTYQNIYLRNRSATAGTINGLGGSLANVLLYYDQAPSLTIPGMTLSGALTVTAPLGSIDQSAALTVAGVTFLQAQATKDIDLGSTYTNNFGSVTINAARNVTLADSNAIDFYRGVFLSNAGNLLVTAGGAITDSTNDNNQKFTMSGGTATFNAGTNPITLDNPLNFWGTGQFIVPAASNLTVVSWQNLVLGNIALTGTLNLSAWDANYNLTQGSGTAVVMPDNVTATISNFGGGVTLAQPDNVFGNLAITGAGNVTLREDNAITQASAWTFNGTTGSTNSTRRAVSLTTSDDQAITLTQSGHAFGDVTLTQINDGASSAGAVSIVEDSDSYFGMTQSSAWSLHGTTTISSGAHSMTLSNPSNIFGPLRITGATGLTNSLASNVILYGRNNGAGNALTDVGSTGAWTAGTGVGATVRLIGYDSTGTTAGGGSINLTNAANVLGDLYVKGTDVTITENATITDGASTSWNASGDTGWITTGATNLVVANPTGKSITLANLTNQLGPLSLTTTGTAGTLTGVLITDNTNLTQSALWNVGAAPVTLDSRTNQVILTTSGNVLGAVTINTANGSPSAISITEDDAITQGSVWALTGTPVTLVAENNKAITLTTSTNVLGALTLTGGAVSITENDPITQAGAWTTTGTTTLNSGANPITLTNAGNVLGDLAIASTTTALSLTEASDITQASAWSLATTPITLSAPAHDILLTQAANLFGDLTLTATDVAVVENAAISDGNAWTVPGLTTLTAGANAIVLDANPASDFGTVRIVSASAAALTDADAVIFEASTVTGTLSISAGGEITQTGALTADSLRLVGDGFATLTNVGNNVTSLAAGFTGGDLAYTDADNFAVAVVGGTSGINIDDNDVSLTSVAGTVTGLTNINASSTSLTLVTGTALTLPQITIAGPQTYTASTVSGSGITLTGNLTSNAAGAMTFHSPIALSNDWVIQSTNSAITFDSTITGANNQLTVNAGSGTIDFFGAISGMGATTDAAVALTVSAGGTGSTFHSTIAANNGLSVTGPAVFTDEVTLANGLVGSTFGGLVTLGKVGGMSLSGFDNFSFNGGVLLQSGAATINSNNSTLTFQGVNTIEGPYGLTLNSGTQTITGLDHIGTDITSLSVTANTPTIPSGGVSIAGPQTYTATSGTSITLQGPVTSTAAGAIAFASPVVVGTATTVTSVDSAITFASTTDGAFDLTLASGTGQKTFTGRVGNLSALGDGTGASLILQGTGATLFSDTLATRSGITAAGPVTFGGNVTLANGDTGSTFGGLVTTGATTLSGFDGLTFGAGLTLTGDVSILSNGSTLAFSGGTVSGPHALTLNALLSGAGTVTGLAQIDTDLTALTVTGQTLALPAAGLAISGPMSFTAAGGITLNGAVGSTAAPATGTISFNGPVTLATGAITVATADAAVSFASTLTGPQNLTVNSGTGTKTFTGAVSDVGTGTGAALTLAGSGTTTFASTVGTNSGLLVQNAGNVTFQNNVTFADGDTGSNFGTGTFTIGRSGFATTLTGFDGLTFGGPVVLTAGPVSLTSSDSAIAFNGTLNGAQNLTINSGTGTTDFAAAVGGTTPIGTSLGTALTLSGTGLTTFQSTLATASGLSAAGPVVFAHNVALGDGNAGSTFAGAVTLGRTGGAAFAGFDGIAFNGPVTLVDGTTTVTSNGSALTFGSTLDGAQALVAQAGAGALQFTGTVGGITPLAALTATGGTISAAAVTTSGGQAYTGAVTLNGALTTTDSAITVTGATTLGADVAISTGAGPGAITFTGATSTINGAHALTLTAGTGNVVLGGVVGGITPLTTFSLSGFDLTVPVINSTSTQSYAALNNLTLSQSRTSSVPLSFTADADGDGSGSFILPTGITLVTSNEALTITAADLDLQGTSTINTGSGLITLTPTAARHLSLGGTDAAGQLTLTASELGRISTSGGFDLLTTGAGDIEVAGIGASSSQNVSGVLRLFAQGSGDVSFVSSASTFNALTAESGSGTINLGQNLTTTNDPLVFASPVATTASVTLASGGGNISFQDTLATNHPLALTTSGGTLAFADDVTGTSTLAISLAGGNVTGLDQLQSTITGLTLSNNAPVTLPTVAINGPQVYQGPVSLTGNLTGTGLTFNNTALVSADNLTLDAGTGTLAFANTLTAGTNNLTLSGDEIDFANAVTGTGALVLQPSTSSLAVAVGGAAATGGLDLTATDLARLPATLASLTLGRAAGTGPLSLAAPFSFTSAPLVLNGGGGITQAGTLTTGALTLRSAAGITLADTTNVLGAITILGTPTSVSVADSTAITQGAAWVLGAAPVTLHAGSQAITLTEAANTFGTLALTGGAVQVVEAAATDLGASNVAVLAVTSAGAITTSGTVASTGATSLKTLADGGAAITVGNASTFGSLSAVSRNAADTTNDAGAITLAPGASTLLATLATTGNVALTAAGGTTLSQDGSSTLTAAGLELLGAGTSTLLAGTNTITTLAANTGTLSFRDDTGFALGTVNTAGLTASGTATLSSTGTVTQLEEIIATGLELLGAGGVFTLTDAANAITTLAGATGTLSFREDSGFSIGTVNTAGLATTGDTTLSSTGTVTQLQRIAAAGLELLGAGGTFTLTNAANAITTLAGSTGTLSFRDDTGFALGTVNTAGVTTTGNLVLSTTGAVTQSQDITTAGLALSGAGGTYTLTRNSNTIPLLAGDTRSADVHTAGALVIGAVNPTGFTATEDLSITAGGAITQTEVVTVGRHLTLTTTHNAGDVAINNNGAASTQLGASIVGGDYTVTASNGPVTQAAGTNLRVVGDLTIDSPSAILDGAGNLIGGGISLPASTSSTVRASGVITLLDRTETGDLTVVSEAASRNFDTGPIHGAAITLSNSANSVGGAISVTTVASAVTAGGAVQTGIVQSPGTTLNVAGVGSFIAEASAAGTLGVVLNNVGNSFGQLRLDGDTVSVRNSAARVTDIASAVAATSVTLLTADAIIQSGAIVTPALLITTPAAVTLTHTGNNISGLTVDAGAAIAFTDANGFAVTNLDANSHAVALTAGGSGAITQTGALVDVTALTLSSGGAITLTNTGNTIGSLAAVTAGGAVQIRDSAGGLTVTGAVQTSSGDITLRTDGNLTLAVGSTITAAAGDLALSAEGTGNFINQAGASTLSASGRWLVYSQTPDLVGTVHTEKGGLTSDFRLYGKTFVSDAPASITDLGDGFIYEDSPTVTLVVSSTIVGTASHIYGDTPTASIGYSVSSGFIDSEDTAGNIGFSGTALFDTALMNTMNAGAYSISYTGGLTSAYPLVASSTGASYSVTPALLTYTANAASRTYGDAPPSLSGSVTGFKLSQTTAALGGAPTWTAGGDVTSPIGSYAINGGGYTSSNYTFTQAAGNATALTVTTRPITLTAAALDRLYGNANPTTGGFTITSGSLANSDALAATLAVSSPATVTSNVGSYALTPSASVFTTGSASNYAVSYADGTLAVIARPLSLTATDQSRIYGNANPTTGAFTIGGSGLVNGDTLAATLAVSSPAGAASNVGSYALTPSSASFTSGLSTNYALTYLDGSLAVTARGLTITADNQSRPYGDGNPATGTFSIGGGGLVNGDTLASLIAVTSPATATSHVGSYALAPGAVTFSLGSASNYTVSYADGSLAVTARPITLTADPQSRLYGNANPTTGAFSIGGSGLVNGDLLAATVAVSSPATVTDNVGDYALNSSGAAFTAGTASDYAVTYATGVLSITGRPLTITATDASRLYGNANPTTGTFSLGGSGLVNGDAVNASLSLSTPATLASHVGSYALTPSALTFSSGSAGNYTLSYVDGALAVTPRPLSLTADGQTRLYGDGNPTTGTFAIGGSGLVNGDTLASTLAVSSPATGASNVGSYALTPADATFTTGLLSDYTITYFDGVLSVTPRAITVTANNQSRLYGDANPTLGTFTLGGGLGGSDVLSSTITVTSPATLTSNVGSYSLVPGAISFSAGSSSNYTISYADGALAVTPAPLTYTATAATRLYGNANPSFTGTFAGFKNADTADSALTGTLLFSSPATVLTNVGSYAIEGSGLSAVGGNYTFVQAPANATALAITPRTLTVLGSDLTRVYGDPNPTSTPATAVGLVNGDTVTAAGVTLTASQTSNVGTYISIPGSTSFSTGLASNYTITYTNGTFTITPRALTVTPTTQARVFGEANPTFGSVFGDNLANGDTLGLAAVSSPAITTSDVGSYALAAAQAAFTQGAAGNYAITYANGLLSVMPRPVTVTAAPQTKVYGAVDPTFTYQVEGVTSGRGLLGGQTLSGALTREAGENVVDGPYTILAGDLTAGANYTISFVSDELTITPRPLTVTATEVSRFYGDANPALTSVVATGLINGDTIGTATALTNATLTSNVGTYALTPSEATLATGLASNYAITYANGVFTVVPRPLTITAATQSRVFGENNPTIGAVSADDLVNGDALGLASVSSAASTTSNVGTYALDATAAAFTQGSASNYAISYASGVLTVTQRPVTVTANAQTRVYGAADPVLTYQIEGVSTGRGLLAGATLGGSLSRVAGESVAGGPYAITQGNLASSNANYSINYVASTLQITPAVLTYIANAVDAGFQVSLVLLDGTVTGFVRGDTLGTATTGTLTWTTDATEFSPPGLYSVVGSGLQAVDGNYVFTQAPGNATALTLTEGASTSIPRPFIPLPEALSFESRVDGRPVLFDEQVLLPAGPFGPELLAAWIDPAITDEDWVSLPADAGRVTF